MTGLQALPRELIKLIATEPAAARTLNRTCRELHELTRGLFKWNMCTEGDGTQYYIYTGDAEEPDDFEETIEYFRVDYAVYGDGDYYDGDDTRHDPMAYVSLCNDLDASVDNLIFVVIDGVVNRSVVQYTDVMVQFVGVCIDRIYRVTGLHNNFIGADWATAVSAAVSAAPPAEPRKYTFAAKTGPKWAIYTTDTPPYQLCGTTLTLELVCADDS